jgi:ubiquinone/menaquinone biosynthesis C-methylase UbiE
MKFLNKLVTLITGIKHPAKKPLLKLCAQLDDKLGLEVGGPSGFFQMKGYFPVYAYAERIDGVNFSDQTIWEGNLQEGYTYKYFDNKAGYQYIAEATDLKQVQDQSYDFLLSCHSLEHTANPVKALFEWNRVLRTGGMLVLVLPNKQYTFDINRPITKMDHLVEDYQHGVDETDTTHFNEILNFHDVSKDPGLKSKEDLEERLQKNIQYRSAHHHVFDFDLIKQMMEYCGFSVVHQQEVYSLHLVTVAIKK